MKQPERNKTKIVGDFFVIASTMDISIKSFDVIVCILAYDKFSFKHRNNDADKLTIRKKSSTSNNN